MSNVIVLRNMLDSMEDLQSEIENGLGQEIGEECGDKYGRVDRLYIDIEGRRVFIKFTDQVSALRVRAMRFHFPILHLYLRERLCTNKDRTNKWRQNRQSTPSTAASSRETPSSRSITIQINSTGESTNNEE